LAVVKPLDAPEPRYFNRELSWLDFNERVLHLAEDSDRPLLERVRFLAIFARNLDEFFQIRVSGLREQVQAEVSGTSPDGMRPRDQLAAIQARVEGLAQRHAAIFANTVRPELATKGVRITDWVDLKRAHREELRTVFEEQVYPVLTPLAVDPAHPFPYIADLSLNLAIVLRESGRSTPRFALIKVPANLPRFVKVPSARRYVPLEQLIAAHLARPFPGLKIVATHAFRVTRDADIDLDLDEADDLIVTLESAIEGRRLAPRAVRLEVDESMPVDIRSFLLDELELQRADKYILPGPLDLGALWQLTGLSRPGLKDRPWRGVTPVTLSARRGERPEILAAIRKQSILVHHPYDRFDTTVQAFIEEAAADPNVLALKQTLYRTSDGDSQVVGSLVRAAQSGKEVVALVELQARGDEEANIAWARTLERAGVHVVYGVVGLKTHTKVCLVVRSESGAIRRYAHIGTGNYNSETARLYEDIGLLTADPALTADVAGLFNRLTGYSSGRTYRRLLVAPDNLRKNLLQLIADETAAPDGRIVMKMNSLVDPVMIDALYNASNAGVEIDLLVRGICCLRPGVAGLSEKIRVRSVVGRYLEHSRIYRFGSDARGPRYWIGSADLMPRNLDHRVECLAPVTDPALAERLAEILEVNLADDVLAWQLGADGWTKVPTVVGMEAHRRLQELAESRARHV
jgi:polyphosphate kinase